MWAIHCDLRAETVEVFVLPVFRRFIRNIAVFGSVLALSLAVAAPANAAQTQHVVKKGEHLTGIASRFGVSLSVLMSLNGLTLKSVIQPGQVLKLPASPVPTAPTKGFPDDLGAPERRALIPIFRAAASEAGVAPDLLMSLAYTESRWSQGARSPDKAIGVGQLLPGTARYIATSLMNEPGLDATKLRDNVRMTAHYLRYLVQAFPGNGERALAAYFEGETLVRKSGPSRSGLRYARKILGGRTLFTNVT